MQRWAALITFKLENIVRYPFHYNFISLDTIFQNNAVISSSAFSYFSLMNGKGRQTERLDKCCCHRWGQTSIPFGLWVQADTSSSAWCLIKSPTSLNIKSYLHSHTFFISSSPRSMLNGNRSSIGGCDFAIFSSQDHNIVGECMQIHSFAVS